MRKSHSIRKFSSLQQVLSINIILISIQKVLTCLGTIFQLRDLMFEFLQESNYYFFNAIKFSSNGSTKWKNCIEK